MFTLPLPFTDLGTIRTTISVGSHPKPKRYSLRQLVHVQFESRIKCRWMKRHAYRNKIAKAQITRKRFFCSQDLDLDAITLMQNWLHTRKMHSHTKMNFLDQCFQQLVHYTQRHTQRDKHYRCDITICRIRGFQLDMHCEKHRAVSLQML